MAQRYAPSSNNTLVDDELENDVSDDEFSQNQDDEVDIQDVLTEIRRLYDISGQDDAPLPLTTNAEDNAEDSAFSALDNAFGNLEHEDKKGCANCSTKRRVTKVSSIEKGQHIMVPGQYFNTYVQTLRTSINVYDHHAIVKEVKSCIGSSVTIVLIHFTEMDGKMKVCEETIEYNLSEIELYIIDYVFPKYEPDEIIARAKSQNDKFKTYNLVNNNCEHFATWCVVGKGQSFQVQSLRQKIGNAVSGLFGAESSIARGIFRLLFSSTDEIAIGLGSAVPGLILGGGVALYLIYCILMTAQHIKDYRNGEICRSCLKGELMDLWLTFGAFGLTSLISFLIATFLIPLLVPGVGIPLMILLVLLAIAFQMAVPRLRKALSSPFSVDRVKVTSLDQIDIGDVISKRQYGVHHTMILTEVDVENEKKTKGSIRVVHYGYSFLFGTRKIAEEYFEVDLEKSTIYLFVCKNLCTFPADVVISRARSRIGESKWAALSNRSAHFAYWAKVKQFDDDNFDDIPNEERPLSCSEATLFIKKKEIHSIEDLRIGDVVKSKIIGRIDNTGILTSIRYLDDNGRKVEIEVCTYTFSLRVSRKNYVVDLDKNRLFVKIYNPAQSQSMEKRAQNARDVVGAKRLWLTTGGFILHCIELKSQ